MDSVFVSVILPIYNGEKWVEKCVRSLLDQTLKEIEYIIINDYSTDKSIFLVKKILKNYPSRQSFFYIISHNYNRGVAAARNTGIENANGEYLFFIDQDDYLESNSLEIFYHEAIKEKVDIVYSDFLYQYKYYSKRKKNKEMKNKKDFIVDLLKFKIPIELWMRLYKKELFFKHSLIFPENTAGADDLLLVPILFYYADKVKYIPFTLYHYVQYNMQAVSKQRVKEKWAKACIHAVKLLEDFFRTKDKLYSNAVTWTAFYAKMLYIEYTRGNTQFKMCASISTEDFKKANKIKEKLICFLGRRNFFLILNFIFDLNALFKFFLLKSVFRYRFFCFFLSFLFIKRNKPKYKK